MTTRKVLMFIWEAISFACVLTVGRIYFGSAPTYGLLIECLAVGIVWALAIPGLMKKTPGK